MNAFVPPSERTYADLKPLGKRISEAYRKTLSHPQPMTQKKVGELVAGDPRYFLSITHQKSAPTLHEVLDRFKDSQDSHPFIAALYQSLREVEFEYLEQQRQAINKQAHVDMKQSGRLLSEVEKSASAQIASAANILLKSSRKRQFNQRVIAYEMARHTHNLETTRTEVSQFLRQVSPKSSAWMEKFVSAVEALSPVINAQAEQISALRQIYHQHFGGQVVGQEVGTGLPKAAYTGPYQSGMSL